MTITLNNKKTFLLLKERVYRELQKDNAKFKGNYKIYIKALFILTLLATSYALTLYFAQYSLIYLFLGLVPSIFFLFWLELSVMHDGSHNTFGKSKFFNKLAANVLGIAGASTIIWHHKHIVAHHNYTNIYNMDKDTETGGVIRFHPENDKKWFHKYQHLYAWPLYGLHLLRWLILDDWVDFFTNKWGLNKKELRALFIELVLIKSWHFLAFLFLPIYITNNFYAGAIFYLLYFSILGFFLSLTFLLAHVTNVQAFPKDKEHSNKDWALHQLATTADFATSNKLIGIIIGGLNFQVAHHIFPNINSQHYPKIQKIIKEFCKENGIDYFEYSSVWSALKDHYRHLKGLGSGLPQF